MKCPTCEHEAPQEAFGSPLRCPDCGAFYEKALELKLRKEAASKVSAEEVKRDAPVKPKSVKGLVPCRSCGTSISKNAVSCPSCGAAPKKKTSVFTWFVVILGGLWFIGYLGSNSNSNTGQSSSSASSSPPAPSVSPLAAAKASTVLVDFDWGKFAGGSLMKADFTIRNGGAVAVKDIEITCQHSGASGTRIDSNKRTIYEVIQPGKTRTFKDFDMGFIHSQAVSSGCSITDLKI